MMGGIRRRDCHKDMLDKWGEGKSVGVVVRVGIR